MWKLFIFTFLYLITSCVDGTSGTAQVATATAEVQSDGKSSSATAVAQVTTKTNESGSGNGSNSNGGSYDDGNYNEDDDEDNNCNVEERDDDYDCTSAMPRVERAIIKISFIRKNNFIQNIIGNSNNYCNINQTQGNEAHVGSPFTTWSVLAMISLYTENETLHELLDFLGLKNKDECACVMKKLKRYIKPYNRDLFFSIIGVMSDKKQYPVTDIFERDVVEFLLNGKYLGCNFNQPQKCARKVNKYGAGKTGNVISEVVSKQKASTVFNTNQIMENVVGSLIKVTFKKSFNTENKTTGIYYDFNGPKITEYLYQEVIQNSTESKKLYNARLMELELKQENAKCVVIIPKTKCDLPSIVAKLASEPQILQDEMKCLERTYIHFTLPVYESYTYEVNVVPALQSYCGFGRVFNESAQIIDSCGKPLNNRSVTYIFEKSTLMVSPTGDEPYVPATPEDYAECGEPVTVSINYPVIFIYFVNNVALIGSTGTVKQVDSCTYK